MPCGLQWDALDEAEKAKYPFQRDLKRRMDGIIADCMKKIERNKERLAAADTPLVTPADQVQPHPRPATAGQDRSPAQLLTHSAKSAPEIRGPVMLGTAPNAAVLICTHGLAAGPCACSGPRCEVIARFT